MEKNKVMMIIIIVLLVVLLGTIVGVFLYTLNIIKQGNLQSSNREVVGLVQEVPKLTVAEIETVPLSTAISTDLKISENGENHVIKLNVAIVVNNTDKKESPLIIELLKKNDALNTDLVLGILRNKTFEDIKQDGEEVLKDELLTKLRETYESNLIYSVILNGIILQ